MNKIYQPKGGMCAKCKHIKSDCSSLPFHTYKEIERKNELAFELIIVKCEQFDNPKGERL